MSCDLSGLELKWLIVTVVTVGTFGETYSSQGNGIGGIGGEQNIKDTQSLRVNPLEPINHMVKGAHMKKSDSSESILRDGVINCIFNDISTFLSPNFLLRAVT